jgi:hypothetical protein
LFSTSIDAATIQAYRETDYRVGGEQPFTLRIGQESPELAALLARHRQRHAAYVTACNPYSCTLSSAENARRHAELGAELTRRGLLHIEGIGQHPTGVWPGEPSYLVLGLDYEAARALGNRLQQNAFVWCDEPAVHTVPELIMLR